MTKNKSVRKQNGRFAKGNPGGPGRPRRAVERDFMQALSEVISIEDWVEIVGAAVELAKTGDKSARDWISKYVLGSEPTTLFEIAKMEAIGIESEHEIDAAADVVLNPNEGEAAVLRRLLDGNGPTEIERAIELARGDSKS